MVIFNPNDITVSDFKAYFDRHFPYAPLDDPNNQEFVRDIDIQNAFEQAKVNFNKGIWDSYESAKIAYLFLTAHYLCMDMRMAESGLSSSGAFAMSSKSVGDVSASYAIPDTFMNSRKKRKKKKKSKRKEIKKKKIKEKKKNKKKNK